MAMFVAIAAAACSSAGGQRDEVGASCPVHPGVVCRDQDLQGVSLAAADLRGADFSGSILINSDLRGADLTNAKLVGALLGGIDFTGASLKNADLSRANLFFTNFTGADLTGANQEGTFICNTVQPDGAILDGDCKAGADDTPTTTGKSPTGPPTIDYFRLEPPGRCVNDASGTGIDVEWSTRNATILSLSVDGVRIDGATEARSTQRLPFVCDGKPHTVLLEAFGTFPPTANKSFTAALQLTAPLAPSGA
jgi:uncharacterized protein YjbI with pentapeptide repeats